jgi:hypothetical protein
MEVERLSALRDAYLSTTETSITATTATAATLTTTTTTTTAVLGGPRGESVDPNADWQLV